LIEKNTTGDGNNSSGNSRNIIGQTFDASHSIIIGGRFSEISTPASIISNPVGWVSNTDQRSTEIIEPSGCNIVFGLNNTLKYSPFTIIQGANNEVLNNTNALSSQLGGSLVVGSSNKIQNEYGEQKTPQNIIFGNNNISNVSQNTFIQGNNNINFGDSKRDIWTI